MTRKFVVFALLGLAAVGLAYTQISSGSSTTSTGTLPPDLRGAPLDGGPVTKAPDPAATDPEATDPAAPVDPVDPEATDPEATDPEATDPEATDPESTEPETTDATVTDPEGNTTDDPDEEEPEFVDPGPTILDDGTRVVTFEELASYIFELPEPDQIDPGMDVDAQIPLWLRKLGGTKAQIEGYMVPIRFRKGAVQSFLLSRYLQGCCFGHIPLITEMVEIKVTSEEGVPYSQFRPVLVTGELEVGAEMDKHGYVLSVYRMKTADIVESESD